VLIALKLKLRELILRILRITTLVFSSLFLLLGFPPILLAYVKKTKDFIYQHSSKQIG